MSSSNVKIAVDPAGVLGEDRRTQNRADGLGVQILCEVVDRYVPTITGDQTVTEKTVIWLERHDCPCCYSQIQAIVEVKLQGRVTAEWKEVQGLYLVAVGGDSTDNNDKINVEKLESREVFSGRMGTPIKRVFPWDLCCEDDGRGVTTLDGVTVTPSR